MRDVQIITAKDTGRSKGFAYVELKSLDDVPVRTRMQTTRTCPPRVQIPCIPHAGCLGTVTTTRAIMILTHVHKNLSTLSFDVQKALMLNNQRFIFRSGKEGFPILVKSSEVRGVRCAANAIASVFDVGCLAILMLLLSRMQCARS